MTSPKSAFVPVTLLAVLASGSAFAADGPLVAKPGAPVEITGPAAKGDAKPFHAVVQAECGGVLCIADFGKKGNKLRTVKWVSCGINTEAGVLQVGQILLTEMFVPVAFFATVSRGVTAEGEVATMEFAQTFEVPAGEPLRVQMITSGTALGAQCVAAGTIK